MKDLLNSKNRKIVFFLIVTVFLISIFFILGSHIKDSILKNKYTLDLLETSYEEKCQDLYGMKDELIKCWADQLDKIIQGSSVDVAMDFFEDLYENQKYFGGICHDVVHSIGQMAYREFIADEDFAMTEKTAYCNYGFYHGFMETLVVMNGDYKQARDFCAFVDKKITSIVPDAALQCYHGIGHGWSNAHDTPLLWGDAIAIVTPALRLCEEVAESKNQLSRCASGVFHGFSDYSVSGEYGLSINKEDPLWLCHQQPEHYKNQCYMLMYGVLLMTTERNFLAAAEFIENIVEDTYATQAMFHLASARRTYKSGDINNHIRAIEDCRALEERLQISCIQGYAFGLYAYNPLENGYKNPLNFCQYPELIDEERLACLESVFARLDVWYPQQKAQSICGTIEIEYRELCNSQLEN